MKFSKVNRQHGQSSINLVCAKDQADGRSRWDFLAALLLLSFAIQYLRARMAELADALGSGFSQNTRFH